MPGENNLLHSNLRNLREEYKTVEGKLKEEQKKNRKLKRKLKKRCLNAPRFLRETLNVFENAKQKLLWNNKIIEEVHIEDWNVSNVETAYGAFYFCKNIKELNLDNWKLNKCTEFDLMFKGCEELDTHFTDNWKITIA